jgi:hypothetical protein
MATEILCSLCAHSLMITKDGDCRLAIVTANGEPKRSLLKLTDEAHMHELTDAGGLPVRSCSLYGRER